MSDQTPATPSGPAAGWYADPSGSGGQRYWDGAAWTEHTVDPTPAAPTAPPAPPAPPVYAPAPPAAPAAPQYAAAPAYAPAYATAPPSRSIGFGEAIKRAFGRWTNYSDRATVGEYWWFYLFSLLITIPIYIAATVLVFAGSHATIDDNGNLSNASFGAGAAFGIGLVVVYAIILFFVTLPLSVRRLHDTDKSGWWLLIGFIPFGSLVLLIFFIMGGTPGPNRYGPPVS